MAGTLVPLVLFPRFSSFTEGYFPTVPMDVSAYQKAIFTVWRGPTTSSGSFFLNCYESTDRVYWSLCTVSGSPDPGPNAEGVLVAYLKKRWFRAEVQLDGGEAQVTCWAAGHLEMREP